ncbi:MAG TPA: hypothetical protein VIA62_11735 [Thermoanaerobaculia bacterium]|jgi:hypothetical protein|nr:hypothetical protein [Thermoanaerobaculia bacterium]
MKTCNKILLSVLVAMIPAVAHAGPGAVIYGCVYVPTAQSSALTVNFTTLGNHCMNSIGSNASMSVSAAGVTCVSVGYVEAQASTTWGNTCGSDDSLWTLSYNVPNTGFSGSALTDWPKNFLGIGHNSLSLQNQSPNTMICGSQSLCTSTSITWDAGSSGPLYIIFQPQS